KGLPFYDVALPGFKANMTDIQAALGVVQLKKLPQINRLRNRAAAWYDDCLKEMTEITPPVIRETNYSARHLYPILIATQLKERRDDVLLELKRRGIFPSVHFIPVHYHSFFKAYFEQHKQPLHLPVAEDLFAREISLPLFPELKKGDVSYVATSLKEILGKMK
ncbi:MAG: DegT/DnrJ/EryC1/StrS aminotransferase family protein, partial [bacterium]|nr:DegT/DnrJ/EryC1/StrS aminotransferase family protein [bacterium]